MGRDANVCLGCSKKFTKNECSVQCTVCGLWIHQVCANMSTEVFELLEKQKKESGITYWACRPCTVYAQGMNHRLKQMAEDIKEVKQNTATNTDSIQRLEKKMEEIVDQAKRTEGISKNDFEARMKEEKEKQQERKDRELNIIVHGVEECSANTEQGEDRRRWDVRQCLNIFKDARLTENDIKFCRRVGARRERGRPIIMGFYNKSTRDKLIKVELPEDISVGPDMTKKQREEEAEIWKEMEEKNKSRTEEQVTKNLFWRLVGPKGERRLILGPARNQAQPPRTEARRGRGALVRGGMVRGTGRWSETYRPRLGSKRARVAEDGMGEEEEEEEEMREPPQKH
jgi:hypothetical protein